MPAQTKIRTQKKERKHLIFSNFQSNCPEDEDHSNGCDCAQMTFKDEQINLDKVIDGRILAIADLGLWNGRRSGYTILDNNIRSILNSFDCPLVEWYGDGHNIKAKMTHHDGTNFIEYRVIREDRNIDGLLSKLYNQQDVTRQLLSHYTKSLYPYVADIYGWS